MNIKKLVSAVSLFLFFAGTGCQLKNNAHQRGTTVSNDSILTEKPSGILLSKTYANKEKRFSIIYPSNWYTFEYKNTGGIDFFGHFKTPSGNNDMSDLGIKVYQKNKSETFEEFCQHSLAEMKAFPEYSDITVERKVSFIYQEKYNAYSFLFTAKSLGTFDTRVHMLIENGNDIYHLRGLLSPKYPAETLQLYLEIMTTIQFL